MAIPLDQIQPHPKLAFRFRYDVASLADSIRSVADGNCPNGQLNPGRVVRKGDDQGYYVYIGVRRFLALKSVHEKTNDPRFGVFNAYVDEGLSEQQMFVKAKAENDEERGERQGLSVLELVSGIRKIRESVDMDRLDMTLKRLLAVAEKMDEDRLKKLYDIERASRSKFGISQLEGLCRIQQEEEFYTTAASAAGFGVEDVGSAEKSREAAYHLEWFGRIFPDYKKEPVPERSSTNQTGEAEAGAQQLAGLNHLEVHEEGVLIVDCPWCKGGNLLRAEGDIDLTQFAPNPEGEKRTKVADTIIRAPCECSHCKKGFFVFVERLDKGTCNVESSISDKFREPKERTETVDLRFDFDKNTWQRIVEGKVVGPLQLAPAKSRGEGSWPKR